MRSEGRNQRYFENRLREIRLENQKRYNASKPVLLSDDVLETADFVFSPIKPLDRVGDSGNLLLAKRKKNRQEQYLVKHEYCDCAANEFVYSKLAQAMGLRMPESKLFHISEGEKRNYFRSGYTVGARFLKVENESPAYKVIREQAVNWEDYHSFAALYSLFLEDDSFEVMLADDNYIYRVDTTSAFVLGDWYLNQAGIDMEGSHGNIQANVKQHIKDMLEDDLWKYSDFHAKMARQVERCGEEARKGFLRPFYGIQEIKGAYIDDFINTLCYFYPDFIGDYYIRFIGEAQKQSYKFLKSLV